MDNETTLQPSSSPENDEFQENIPGVTAAAGTSNLKVHVGNVVGCSPAQPSGENEPLSDTCTSSAPAPTSSNGGVKSKSRISGLSLTPVFKYLNISNRRPSPEPSRKESHFYSVPFPFGFATANGQKSTGGSSQHPNPYLSGSNSGPSLGEMNPPVCWQFDCLPEITLLDVTCDSTLQQTRNDSALPDSVPATPVKAGADILQSNVKSPKVERERSLAMNRNSSADGALGSCDGQDVPFDSHVHSLSKQNGTQFTSETSPSDIHQSISDKTSPSKACHASTSTKENHTQVLPPLLSHQTTAISSPLAKILGRSAQKCEKALLRWLDDSNFPEITLLEITRDSEASPGGEISSTEATWGISPVANLQNNMPSSELSGKPVAEPGTGTLDGNVTHTINSLGEQSHECVRENLTKPSLEVTWDISMRSALEDSKPSLELSGQNMVKIQTSAEDTLGTHPANLNTITQTSSPQNQTLDLPPINGGHPKVESDTEGQAASVCKDTMEISPANNQDCSAGKASGSCDVQNTTFDKTSLQKTSINSTLGETSTKSFSLQNNTFDSKPQSKQNGTITLSETSSSNSHQNTADNPSPTKVLNSTSSPKNNNSDVHQHDLTGHETKASTDSNARTAPTPGSTFNANPAVEVAPAAAPQEAKDRSQSGLPLTEGLSDPMDHQSSGTENNNTSAFNLDDTFDFRADFLVTSTPMTNCKMFDYNGQREEGKIQAEQKKLYAEGPPKPDAQASSDVPPNIICDRKTLLTLPAARSLLPSSKMPSQLLKYKPASARPGRFDPLTSGLPMTRQRNQAEALKNAAASDSPQVTTGISSSYNLRTKTTGLKQPTSGLRKPQLGGVPSGIQRAASGLRAPAAPPTSSTDRLTGPTATNPVTKLSQAKKHPLARGEALPIPKRKKTDAPVPPTSAEASTPTSDAAKARNLEQPAPSQRALPAKTQRDDAAVPVSTAEPSAPCDAASRARAVKQPANSHRGLPAKPQGRSCPKCVVFEQQLKMKSEEIRRLRGELLKYRKEEEC